MYSQDNIEELFELIGTMPEHKFVRTKNFDFVSTTNSIWPNQLLNLKVDDDNLEEILDEIENQQPHTIIPKLLMCNPSKDSTHIINRIKSRHYNSSEWTAMSYYLTSCNNKLSNSGANLCIKLMSNKNDLRLWIDIVEIELMAKSKLNTHVFEVLLKEKNCYFFLGFKDNLPVATSLLFNGKNSAGIYLVSTVKSYRNNGLGKQMIYKCLNQAKELKNEKVDIQATDIGKHIYKSLGFKDHGIINVFNIEKKSHKIQ